MSYSSPFGLQLFVALSPTLSRASNKGILCPCKKALCIHHLYTCLSLSFLLRGDGGVDGCVHFPFVVMSSYLNLWPRVET